MPDVVIGLDLGGTNIKTAVCSLESKLLSRDVRPTDADRGRDVVLDRMAEGVEAALHEAGLERSNAIALGIGVPGPINWRTGLLYKPPNLPGWRDVPVADLMLQRAGIPTFVDNDANVACYGEYWGGAGRGVECMCCLTLGTGLGGGIVVLGQLLRGLDGTAAELGHMKVQRDGRPCGCGATGCLEPYASVTGLVHTAVEQIEAGRDTVLTQLCDGDLSELTGKMISDAANAGDELAREALHETGVWIGLGCSSLINIFNPERIVLCGGMVAAGDVLLDPIRQTAKDTAFGVPAKRVQIVPAGLGADSGVIGAAGCALARLQGH